ncbi:MAG: 2-amino-4-hydroxy-6-hydroxymethyldihydropteridine diphosphokinase [Candidatus Aureabacteria bacterium]|nr:2-amino-4-hydroxy-6-hydroxymethyldihydropteridine diphosphokinase [Candidatus Auribacterota bacterium]
MKTALLSIGSNKGKRLDNIRRSVQLLIRLKSIKVESISSIYRSDPVDDADQPFFYNIAVSLKTRLSPHELFQYMVHIEKVIGKEKEREKGPRRIDLDVLFYDDVVLKDDILTIPHPSIEKRLFVLKPLMEIAPFTKHPVLRKSVRDLYFNMKTDKQVKYRMPFPCLTKRK